MIKLFKSKSAILNKQLRVSKISKKKSDGPDTLEELEDQIVDKSKEPDEDTTPRATEEPKKDTTGLESEQPSKTDYNTDNLPSAKHQEKLRKSKEYPSVREFAKDLPERGLKNSLELTRKSLQSEKDPEEIRKLHVLYTAIQDHIKQSKEEEDKPDEPEPEKKKPIKRDKRTPSTKPIAKKPPVDSSVSSITNGLDDSEDEPAEESGDTKPIKKPKLSDTEKQNRFNKEREHAFKDWLEGDKGEERTFPRDIGLSSKQQAEKHELLAKKKNGDLSWFDTQRLHKLHQKSSILHMTFDDLHPSEQEEVKDQFHKQYQEQQDKRKEEKKKTKSIEKAKVEKQDKDLEEHTNKLHQLGKKINSNDVGNLDKEKAHDLIKKNPELAHKILGKHGIELNIPKNDKLPPSWDHKVNEKHLKKGAALRKLINLHKRAEKGAKEGHFKSQKTLEHLQSVLDHLENFSAKARAEIIKSGIHTKWNKPKEDEILNAKDQSSKTDSSDRPDNSTDSDPSSKSKEPPKEDSSDDKKQPKEDDSPDSKKEPSKEDPTGQDSKQPSKTDTHVSDSSEAEQGNYKTPEEFRQAVGRCPPGYAWNQQKKRCEKRDDAKPDEIWKPGKQLQPNKPQQNQPGPPHATIVDRGRNIAKAFGNFHLRPRSIQNTILNHATTNINHIAAAGHKATDENRGALRKTLSRIVDAVKPHLTFLRRHHAEKAGELYNAIDKAHHTVVKKQDPETWKSKNDRLVDHSFNELARDIDSKDGGNKT